MPKLFKIRWLLLVLLWTGMTLSASRTTVLLEKLQRGSDFRIRVQAALELGKVRSKSARVALERALSDEHASVRAAAAAALAQYGDARSIEPLTRKQNDRSPAVRAAVARALTTLKAKQEQRKKQLRAAKVIVKLGKIDVLGGGSDTLAGKLLSESRAQLAEVPGVLVMEDGEDAPPRSPIVMVTGTLRRIEATSDGGAVVYSARVDYILHRMPEQDIAGTVSGSARTRATPEEASNKRKDAELQALVLQAAVASAMRRAPEALVAAAK